MSQRVFKLDTSVRKEYLYLIHPRNYEMKNRPIYKIGRTDDLPKRLKFYPKNSVIHKIIRVKNCHFSERKLINSFKMNFTHRSDIGREYFEGDCSDMISCMKRLIDVLEQRINDPAINNNVKEYYGNYHRIVIDGKIHNEISKCQKIKKIKKNQKTKKN